MRWLRRQRDDVEADPDGDGVDGGDGGDGAQVDLGLRLARLVVEALEVGSGKRERDVIDELFEAFGLDFASLERQVPPRTKDRVKVLQARAADELARAAPGVAALLQEVLKRGSRFVAMLDEVYWRLAKHHATALVAAEVVRIGREEVRIDLNISEAFIEQVRERQRVLERIATGAVDERSVRSFVNMDNGGCYGRWPLGDYDNGFPLAEAIHHLGWISERVRAETQAGFTGLSTAVDEANRAADRLCSVAERLVHAHVLHLDLLERARAGGEEQSDEELRRRLYFRKDSGNDRGTPLTDVETFRGRRLLGIAQYTGNVSGAGDFTFMGVDADGRYTSFSTDGFQDGSGLAVLATFLAMRRMGAYYSPQRERLETTLFESEDALAQWLDRVRTGCEEATRWLSEDVVRRSGTITVSNEIESIREFLNLPLWKARDLLYEIWVLCATLTACEESGWDVELRELEGTVWTLAVGATERPVALLARGDRPEFGLEVWREPRRGDHEGGVLTPDVTIATSGPLARDLVVVEAKDRMKMSLGSVVGTIRTGGGRRTAVGVAQRYAEGLRPSVTWVCNHCDVRQPVDPSENHGDPWSRIHVAGSFRPGELPDDFRRSIQEVISPRDDASAAEAPTGLLLVIDWTASFRAGRTDALSRLAGGVLGAGAEVRAVLYADHGDREPFLVRKLGPAPSVAEIVRLLKAVRPGHGGDLPEALEDALSRCREIVADVGPQDVLILTDAPPHEAADCAYGIDYREEIRGLLEAGCRVLVATDWDPSASLNTLAADLPSELRDGLVREPLGEIMDRLAAEPAGTPSRV